MIKGLAIDNDVPTNNNFDASRLFSDVYNQNSLVRADPVEFRKSF